MVKAWEHIKKKKINIYYLDFNMFQEMRNSELRQILYHQAQI